MSHEICLVLARLLLVSSLVMLVVLGVRHWVRRLFGATIGYALWLLVPVSMVAIFMRRPESLPIVVAGRGQSMLDSLAAGVWQTATDTGWSHWLLWIWLIGVLSSFALTVLAQSRLLRRLGPLKARDDGSWQARDDVFGPMLIGILQPRIVVPAGFDKRYCPKERVLILAHEHVHRRRGDVQLTALVVLLRCLQWFNPIAHLAAQAFRKDQEFACDAAVIGQFPNARRTYADAMLKTQLADSGLPVGCFWQSSHPIMERIIMFNKPLPGQMKRATGSSVLCAAVLATSCLVWAAQASEVKATYATTKPPSFPDNLGDAFVEAAVYLKVEIAADGAPIQVELDHITPASLTQAQIEQLEKSATASVKSWIFNPAKQDGVAKSSWVIVPITYSKDSDSNATPVEEASKNSMHPDGNF